MYYYMYTRKHTLCANFIYVSKCKEEIWRYLYYLLFQVAVIYYIEGIVPNLVPYYTPTNRRVTSLSLFIYLFIY